MSLKMVHGVTHKSATDTIQGKISTPDCKYEDIDVQVHTLTPLLQSSYQRLYFRNLNHPIVRPSVVGRRQEIRNETRAEAVIGGGSDPKYVIKHLYSGPFNDIAICSSHIFDGVTTTKETAAFQLCDITDPMLKEMIEDDEDLRETPHVRASPCFVTVSRVNANSSHILVICRKGTAGIPHITLNRSRLSCGTSFSRSLAVTFLRGRSAKRCSLHKRGLPDHIQQ